MSMGVAALGDGGGGWTSGGAAVRWGGTPGGVETPRAEVSTTRVGTVGFLI